MQRHVVNVTTGKRDVIECTAEEIAEVQNRITEDVRVNGQQYRRDRAAAYPSIGDQLDMIYRAGLGGDEFQSAIASVKSRFPK